MQMCGFGLTTSGRVRPANEDALLVDDEHGIFIVCDGMGGHAAGEVASSMAVEASAAFLRGQVPGLSGMVDEQRRSEAMVCMVEEAIREAGKRIFEAGSSKQEYSGMGTTLTMLLVFGTKAVMGHVGDSRLYLLRSGVVNQLSADHTLVADMWRSGALSAEQMNLCPLGHILTRALGNFESVQVDTLVFDLLPHDRFLLCTDGLCAGLGDADELAQLLGEDEAAQVPVRLAERAEQRDGADNITALVVADLEATVPSVEQTRKDDIILRLEILHAMYLFNDLSLMELLHVADVLQVLTCPQGQALVTEGDRTEHLYIVLEGAVKVTRGGKAVAVIGKGGHFGEMALLNQTPRVATVTTMEPSRLLIIAAEDFMSLVRKKPEIGVKLLMRLAEESCRRLAELDDRHFGDLRSDTSVRS